MHSRESSANNEDQDRQNRFIASNHGQSISESNGSVHHHYQRERAASQPPRSNSEAPNSSSSNNNNNNNGFMSSPAQQQFIPSSSLNRSPWMTGQRMVSPTRINQPGYFTSTIRERPFSSTFEEEDDEGDTLSSSYQREDELYVPPSLSRGRNTYGADISRSRSQSIATTTTRPAPIGSPFLNSGGGSNGLGTAGLGGGESRMQSFNDSFLSSHNSLLHGRFNDLRAPGSGAGGGGGGGSGGIAINRSSQQQNQDISNVSPFLRDVGQILLDDGSAFKELWAGMHPPRDFDTGGGGSGTTSRRHSVSVVQPRRVQTAGFNVPLDDDDFGGGRGGLGGAGAGTGGGSSASYRSGAGFGQAFGGRGGLMLSDDDLASDLGLLNIDPSKPPPPSSSSSNYPPSQPASLPIYAPPSRTSTSSSQQNQDTSPYLGINLNIPGGGGSSFSSRNLRTPSDVGEGTSPSLSSKYDAHFAETYGNGSSTASRASAASRQSQASQLEQELTARYTPGQGIQYLPPSATSGGGQGQQIPQGYARARATSYSQGPTSPTAGRLHINPQQPPYYPQAQAHRSPTHQHAPPHQPLLSELGKGLPLSSVPSSWPLFIVEFKAGRTDLFYLTDLTLDIRVGDLVVVEGDRGKDLGKVVNDSITIAEVEAFQREQLERSPGVMHASLSGEPTSPGGPGSAGGKKEINPKMMYGKAGPQETAMLAQKMQDEMKALQLCQSKVKAKKLPMEVVDAEYQWDRRKLTFYFVAEKRIDFRELVRELFRLYKTRIWMASLSGGGGYEQ